MGGRLRAVLLRVLVLLPALLAGVLVPSPGSALAQAVPGRAVIFVPGLGTWMQGIGGAPVDFAPLGQALAAKGVAHFYTFSYRGGSVMPGGITVGLDYGCDETGVRSLAESVVLLAQQVALVHQQWPNDRITLVGHSYGGLLAVSLLGGVASGGIPTGLIDNVVSLDAPLHGAGRFRTFVAGVGADALGLNPCDQMVTSSRAADDLLVIKDNRAGWDGYLSAWITGARQRGTITTTFGNMDDCLYRPEGCAGPAGGTVASGLLCVVGVGLGCGAFVTAVAAGGQDDTVSQIAIVPGSQYALVSLGTGNGSFSGSHNVVRSDPFAVEYAARAATGNGNACPGLFC